MKVVALVFSARQRGNCYNLAEVMLNHLKTNDVETEILNSYDYKITPAAIAITNVLNRQGNVQFKMMYRKYGKK